MRFNNSTRIINFSFTYSMINIISNIILTIRRITKFRLCLVLEKYERKCKGKKIERKSRK